MVIYSHEPELGERLEALYHTYNDPRLIQFDPIKYVYLFDHPHQREIMGLIASSLAFGRVTQIFKAIDKVLEITNQDPLGYIEELGERPEPKLLAFKYRFVTGEDLWEFFSAISRILALHGSIGEFVRKNTREGFFSGLDQVLSAFQGARHLMPTRLRASACKRFFMYLRWMVREDNIDLGLWSFISPSQLLIPLDTHIFKTAQDLGLTSRNSPSFLAAVEITEALRGFCPQDPVKYDWALSHVGIIRNNFSLELYPNMPGINYLGGQYGGHGKV